MTDKFQFKHALRRGSGLMIATGAAVLTACGGSGNGYTSMMTGTTTPPTMTTAAPTITLTSPGTTVNRTVTLTASPTAATGVTVTRVDFMVDGTVIGSATTSPYNSTWSTSTVTDGTTVLPQK